MGDPHPYQAPRSAIAPTVPAAYGEISVFSAQGRLGRVRYIGYSVGLGVLINLLGGLLGGFAAWLEGGDGQTEWLMGGAFIVLALVALMMSVLLTIQRLHDFDASGWWSLLLLVPLANVVLYLVLLFMPGTQGSNRFGGRPPPNTRGAIILMLILPIIVIMGIAAVAIPAYQDYVERAREAKR